MAHKEISRLPYTRKEQIGYLIKYEASFLFLYGLITFLFLLPLLAAYYSLILITRGMINNNATNNELFNIFLIFGLIIIPCVFIFGIGNMGLFNNIKELTLLSSTHLSSFFKGIKKNFRTFYKYYLLLSILIGLAVINLGNVMFLKDGHTLKLVIFAINIILVLLILIVKPYVMFEASVFNNGTLAFIRNGFYFFGKNFLKSSLQFLIFIIPYILILLLPINLAFIPIFLLSVGYISLYALINFITNLDIFESTLPKEEIASIYHAGLEN